MKKKQGYNARLDESMGMRDGKKSQSLKDRRDESKGMEKASGKRAYSADKSMDQIMMGGGKMKQMYESGGMIKAILKDPKQRAMARKFMQGYNDRLDESMGMRDGKASSKKQSMKDRRDESSAMEPRKYGAVSTMKYRK